MADRMDRWSSLPGRSGAAIREVLRSATHQIAPACSPDRARARSAHSPCRENLESTAASDTPIAAAHTRELHRPVCGIDVDENRSDLRRGKLRHHPLRAVRRPNANPVALLYAESQQAAGGALHLVSQLRIAVALMLMTDHKPIVIRIGSGGVIKHFADTFAEQRDRGGSARIAQLSRATQFLSACGWAEL